MVTLTFNSTTIGSGGTLSLTVTKSEGQAGMNYAPHAVKFDVAVSGSSVDADVTSSLIRLSSSTVKCN